MTQENQGKGRFAQTTGQLLLDIFELHDVRHGGKMRGGDDLPASKTRGAGTQSSIYLDIDSPLSL